MDRYAFRELLGPTVLGFSLFTFILLMNHLFFVAQKAVAKNLSWDVTVQLFMYELPSLLVLTIPMGVLLGCLIGIGRLSADSEWIALQAAGQGTRVLIRPALLLGFLGTLLSLYLYWEVQPDANLRSREIQNEIIKASNMASDLTPRTFFDPPSAPFVLYVDDIRAGVLDGSIDGVFIHKTEGKDRPHEVVLAQRGNIYPQPGGTGNLEADLWDGVQYRFRPEEPDGYRTISFDSVKNYELPTADFIKRLGESQDLGPRDMNYAELMDEFRDAKKTKSPTMREIRLRMARIELHMRIALPFTCLLFAMISVPLGITRARTGKGAGFALALGIIAVYYLVFMFARQQATIGNLPAVLGPWSGVLAILPWFVHGLRRLRRPAARERGLIVVLVNLWCWMTQPARKVITPRAAAETDRSAIAEETVEAVESLGGTSARFIRRIDTYVSVQFLKIVLLTLLSSYFLFFIAEFRNLLQGALDSGEPISLIPVYYAYFAPGLLPFTLSISTLVGAMVAVTVLSRSGELTAIKASGTSARRAIVPIVALALCACVLLFVVEDQVAPETNQQMNVTKDRILGRSARTYGASLSGRWVAGRDGRTLYNYRIYDGEARAFQSLNIFTINREARRFEDHRFCETARWNESSWTLRNCWYRGFPLSGGVFEPSEERLELPLDPPEHFVRGALVAGASDKITDQMDVTEVREEIRTLRKSGYDTTEMEVTYFLKFSRPLTPFVMVLIGLPFAFKIGRRGSLYGIGVAILVVIVYWATFAIFNALGLETILPPFLAAWAPNILYGLLGSTLLLYVKT